MTWQTALQIGARTALGMLFLLPWTAFAQTVPAKPGATAKAATKAWTPPRGQDGHPLFEGVWTNKTITPLERPKALGDKAFFTASEAEKFEKERVRNRDDRDKIRGTVADVINAYNDFWWDSGTKVLPNLRTSIIVDPADGRMPALTQARQERLEADARLVKERCERPGCAIANSGQMAPADKPEDLDLMTRCISFGTVVPMLPSAYNNNYQIVQAPGSIAITTEMVHQVRRIPTDNSAHLPGTVKTWYGDPRGHWEGDTLVVDSTNFNGQFQGLMRLADQNLHLIEKFTRTGPNTLLYQFTVDDPTAFTKQFSGEIPLTRLDEMVYEYACHEGNRGLANILTSARADVRKAAAAPVKK
jgi:hypothetical protein